MCDRCGHELLVRRDDTPEVIRKRWEVFMTENTPLIDYYKDKGNLIMIDANGEASEVLQDIIKKLHGRE